MAPKSSKSTQPTLKKSKGKSEVSPTLEDNRVALAKILRGRKADPTLIALIDEEDPTVSAFHLDSATIDSYDSREDILNSLREGNGQLIVDWWSRQSLVTFALLRQKFTGGDTGVYTDVLRVVKPYKVQSWELSDPVIPFIVVYFRIPANAQPLDDKVEDLCELLKSDTFRKPFWNKFGELLQFNHSDRSYQIYKKYEMARDPLSPSRASIARTRRLSSEESSNSPEGLHSSTNQVDNSEDHLLVDERHSVSKHAHEIHLPPTDPSEKPTDTKLSITETSISQDLSSENFRPSPGKANHATQPRSVALSPVSLSPKSDSQSGQPDPPPEPRQSAHRSPTQSQSVEQSEHETSANHSPTQSVERSEPESSAHHSPTQSLERSAKKVRTDIPHLSIRSESPSGNHHSSPRNSLQQLVRHLAQYSPHDLPSENLYSDHFPAELLCKPCPSDVVPLTIPHKGGEKLLHQLLVRFLAVFSNYRDAPIYLRPNVQKQIEDYILSFDSPVLHSTRNVAPRFSDSGIINDCNRWSYSYLPGVIRPPVIFDSTLHIVKQFLEDCPRPYLDFLRGSRFTEEQAEGILVLWARNKLLYHILRFVNVTLIARIYKTRRTLPRGGRRITLYPCPDCSCGLRVYMPNRYVGASSKPVEQKVYVKCNSCPIEQDFSLESLNAPSLLTQIQSLIHPTDHPADTSEKPERLLSFVEWKPRISFLLTVLAFLGPLHTLDRNKEICRGCQIANRTTANSTCCALCRCTYAFTTHDNLSAIDWEVMDWYISECASRRIIVPSSWDLLQMSEEARLKNTVRESRRRPRRRIASVFVRHQEPEESDDGDDWRSREMDSDSAEDDEGSQEAHHSHRNTAVNSNSKRRRVREEDDDESADQENQNPTRRHHKHRKSHHHDKHRFRGALIDNSSVPMSSKTLRSNHSSPHYGKRSKTPVHERAKPRRK